MFIQDQKDFEQVLRAIPTVRDFAPFAKMTVSPIHAFGYHTDDQIKAVSTAKNAAKVHNIAKILSYIPVIGTIAAIFKLVMLASETPPDEHIPFRTALIVRSCFELTSLGILLLIPDLIVTIGRNLPKPAPSVQ